MAHPAPTPLSLAQRILKERGRPAPSYPVTVRIVGRDGGREQVSEFDAVFVFVPDQARLEALDKATAALAGKSPTEERRVAEEAYHLLLEALRNPEQIAERVFATVVQAKSMLVEAEAVRLRNEYQRFLDINFPSALSPDEMQRIVEAARAHFLPDLLTSFGVLPILRALPSLGVACGAPLIVMSSPTASAPTSPDGSA